MALAALRDAHGDVAQLATLLNAIYLAYFLDPTELQLYRRAEAALQDCAERGEPTALTDLERAAGRGTAAPLYRRIRVASASDHGRHPPIPAG
ncbi:TPA: hypothetical protein ACU9T0_006115 [Burkholderia cenocepacia]